MGIAAGPTRFAVRQALDQEFQKYKLRKSVEGRQARYLAGAGDEGSDDATMRRNGDLMGFDGPREAEEMKPAVIKRDFFGRVISDIQSVSKDVSMMVEKQGLASSGTNDGRKVWVSFHEGFSNAVRKPITLEELMRGFR